ncbi:MAG: hypothetical protein M5R36_13195 [Deltaproteobacteria bacterium]|nr:hypothetical protein [Deltaproteobacteria bacterium]
MGYTGQISLGHAAFLAIGAYACVLFIAEWHLPFFAALLLAGLVSGALGFSRRPAGAADGRTVSHDRHPRLRPRDAADSRKAGVHRRPHGPAHRTRAHRSVDP